MMHTKTIKFLIAGILLLILLSTLLWHNPEHVETPARQLQDANNAQNPSTGDKYIGRATKTDRSNHDTEKKLTPSDDPEIKKITDQLKALETKRTSLCRREENDKRILFEYLIKRPSSEEVKEIKNLISQVNGLTQNQDFQDITWKQQLTNDYLPPPDFEHLIIGIVYTKNNRRGDFSVQGVPFGNLIMRNGNAPFSKDGLAHLIYHKVGFKFGTNWRYSHLLNSEPEKL